MNNSVILVIEDNPTNLSVIAQALHSMGWQVRIATDGEDGLSKAKFSLPDLILLDVQMPGMDGFQVCQQLKADAATADIPVIFMTALADAKSKIRGLSLGAVDYITKPFEQEEAIVRIRTHLQIRHLTQTLEQQVQERTQRLTQALADLQQSQLKLVQNEKMSALGNLVAGVAHEINNPIASVVGNTGVVENYMQDLLDMLDLYDRKMLQPDAEILDKRDEIDLDYIRQDLPNLIQSMKNGGDRIIAISKSLRTFSRGDTDKKQKFDLHEGIESTLLILRHRLKADEHRPAIEVVTDYGNLPELECFPGQLNQVLMNLLANAIDALEESNQGRSFSEITANPNQIKVQTLLENEQIKVAIADNGPGILESVKNRIFDHLFTTKEVGKGTGLGLAIAHQIVVENHGGAIEVHSQPEQGTIFTICLPTEERNNVA
jgi:signal transduction histidine kinase